MKSTIKSWAVNNLLEFSTWIGLIVLVREILSYHSSTLMVIIALVLIFVSDSKINAFIKDKTPGLKAWIESL